MSRVQAAIVKPERHFASDNNAGVHPNVLAALADANGGHVTGYGDDPYTHAAEAAMRDVFGPDTQTFFAFTGTGANVVTLASALRPYQAVVVPALTHLDVDECGAFERFAGSKIRDVSAHNGKLLPADAAAALRGFGDQHHVQPGAISVSQATEVGTVYTADELRALADLAHAHGLFFHVDGARFANAVAALGISARDLITATGVDALTFGGTKNGAMGGEAIVFPRPHPAIAALPFVRKSAMQLASKMRFVAVQFTALLRDDLWLKNAAHANAMARRLADRVCRIDGVSLAYPLDANGAFVALPHHAIPKLQQQKHFYVWDERASVVRWMTSWDTTEDDVDAFAELVETVICG